ncbi:MAG: hypothetical protein GY710_05515 [Desulfobacteraceae bacterium]|nr:hypothetical protein [Desulfobacteraceae bacterium]
MKDDLKKELKLAHGIGVKKINHKIKDIIFEYNEKLFRTKIVRGKVKTKLICNVVPKLIAIVNKGTDAKSANEYLFRIRGSHFNPTYEKYFKPKNLTSNVSFTTQLMKAALLDKFSGNKDDFNKFFNDEIDQLSLKN